MNLYFLRHGKAEARSVKWRPDSIRPLTDEGEKITASVARGIKALDVSFDIILSSPYTRALRTAELLAEAYDSEKIFETPNLAADANLEKIVEEISQNFATAKEIILVGHEPFMGHLISTLLTGEAGMAMELKKAGFCRLNIDKLIFGKCAKLGWFLTPKQLSKLGKR